MKKNYKWNKIQMKINKKISFTKQKSINIKTKLKIFKNKYKIKYKIIKNKIKF